MPKTIVMNRWSDMISLDTLLCSPNDFRSLMSGCGAYAIFIHSECIYIGCAGGIQGESVGARIIKHYAKLTGWMIQGIGKVPLRWKKLQEASLRISDVSVRVFPCANADVAKQVEATLLDEHARVFSKLPLLNARKVGSSVRRMSGITNPWL